MRDLAQQAFRTFVVQLPVYVSVISLAGILSLKLINQPSFTLSNADSSVQVLYTILIYMSLNF